MNQLQNLSDVVTARPKVCDCRAKIDLQNVPNIVTTRLSKAQKGQPPTRSWPRMSGANGIGAPRWWRPPRNEPIYNGREGNSNFKI